MLVFTTDKKRLLEHFRKDPVLFAYHIGDLDDFFFGDCLWAATYGRSSAIEDVVLVYTGGQVPTVLAFGTSENFPALLEDLIPLLPTRFHCHYWSKYRHIISSIYREKSLGIHQKMKLTSLQQTDRRESASTCIRLGESHERELLELYKHAYPGNYFIPRMLTTGKYLGYTIDNRIVAVSGVHVYSDEYEIAVLGNIATHPEYRGQGFATTLTAHLSNELSREGKLVCLNVKADNEAAIRCYEKLGFIKTHEYEEYLFELK